MGKDLILRVQSGDHGTTRVSVKDSDATSLVHDQVQELLQLPQEGWSLYTDRNLKTVFRSSRSKTLADYRLKQGDMLYLKMKNSGVTPSTSSEKLSHPLMNGFLASSQQLSAKEDEVDVLLESLDGKIYRQMNPQMCQHGLAGRCVHCLPLEPFDESHLRSLQPPIKFLSFHSYVRKLRSGVDKGKFVSLENLSCKIKDCKEHAPWPAGICTKCQPNAITLNRQAFRHVDFVQIENGVIVDRFLNYWRESGQQRMCYLLGRYEQHTDMPLAIRAVVSAIYEPPQICTKNSIEILEDPQEKLVDELAAGLGIRRIGWMFTDLSALDLTKGTVKHTRGPDTYFLSAEECITAADFQNKHPNVCKLSSDGIYGSKFVTVVVTGDQEERIHFEAYQVSDQCMGLVRDDCLIPTYDAPELGYIKESSNSQYVPDVFYKQKDKYGNEVTRLARPLPVEYLLTDMAVAFSKEQTYSFVSSKASIEPFPACNRNDIGYSQDLPTLAKYMSQFSEDEFLEAVSDFNILLYISQCEVLPLKECMLPLLHAVRDKDTVTALQWSHNEQWSTMTHILQASAQDAVGTSLGQGRYQHQRSHSAVPSTWACRHCTYINTDVDSCDICNLPKTG